MSITAAQLLLLAALHSADTDVSLAVSDHRICATLPNRRRVACIESAQVWVAELPEDVPGVVVDLHTGPHPLCVRAEPSDTLLCWSDRGQTLEERAEGVQDAAWGRAHLCSLSNAGTVACWGNNDHGQLGDGTRVYRSKPVPVDLPPATAISASSMGTCALLEDRTVRCWGDNPAWGDDRRLTPAPVPGLDNVRQLLPDMAAVSSAGVRVFWEPYNDRVALFSEPRPFSEAPYDVRTKRPRCHLHDGAVRCPGRDGWDIVRGVSHATELVVGENLACARDTQRRTLCWGSGTRFPLPSSPPLRTPQRINIPDAQDVAVGGAQACARTKAGDVWCWQSEPERVVLPHPALELAASASLSCARTPKGTWCWNNSAKVPAQTFEGADVQRFMPNSDNYVCVGKQTIQCSATPGRHTLSLERPPFRPQWVVNRRPCAMLKGRMRCFTESRGVSHKAGGTVEDNPRFDARGLRQVFVADRWICGRDQSGKVSCNEPLAHSCERGLGLRRCRDAHVEDQLPPKAKLALGSAMGCARTPEGAVQCWESSADGPPPAPDPLYTVELPLPAREVSVHHDAACAVLQDGSTWCWGGVNGPLGAQHRPRSLGRRAVRMPWLEGK